MQSLRCGYLPLEILSGIQLVEWWAEVQWYESDFNEAGSSTCIQYSRISFKICHVAPKHASIL